MYARSCLELILSTNNSSQKSVVLESSANQTDAAIGLVWQKIQEPLTQTSWGGFGAVEG